MPSIAAPQDFLTRWQNSGAAERANFQSFLNELCDYLGLPRPDPAQPDDSLNHYVFEKPVQFRDIFAQSTGFIDLYKRGCFVLEAKQGAKPAIQPASASRPLRRGTAIRGTAHWDEAMLAARGQAEQYAKALPVSHGWPPFLIVVRQPQPNPQQIAAQFKSASRAPNSRRVAEILETLTALGQTRESQGSNTL